MRLLILVMLCLSGLRLQAQDIVLKGKVSDTLTHEALTGVTVSSGKTGSRTGAAGEFSLKLNPGTHTLRFSYTGYKEKTLNVSVKGGMPELQVELSTRTRELQIVTVSGSRYEKRAAEEIVSIEVVKPAQIMSMANNSMDDALQRVPGVDVVENQVNIRGGSGWSYGAGSRVLVLVDDMPMLTADAGDAKWDFLPLENCEQIEVLKGASSSLYGSSALNGVINFRTGFARNKPRTKAMLYNGLYGNPPDKSWAWWGKQQPGFQGGYLSHAQKFGHLDVVFGSAWYSEDSYLQGDLNRRVRGNLNLRYRFKKIEGLIAGINTNVQRNKSQTFFFWQPDSSGTKYYQPFGGLDDSSTTINKNNGQRMNIDPYLVYTGRGGTRHTLRTRFFRSKNDIPEKKQSSQADTWYGEYQMQRTFLSKNKLIDQLNVVAGLVGSYSDIVGELYGNHTVVNAAPYVQLEKKWSKLWTTVGARYELNQVDTYRLERKPVFRAGVNYEVDRGTFVRASWGQGYRYPSIAERFVKTEFGASKVFPNPGLQSETGWSAEIGIKQGFRFGSWMGFLDLAAFWTQYYDMMEFNFGVHLPADSAIGQVSNVLDYLGFKSINVGDTRINGLDLSVMGEGRIARKVNSRFVLGYTYMNPTLLNPDSVIMANVSGETKTLKYRYRHSFKFDWENSYGRLILGSTFLYNSFMQNVDAVFTNTKPMQNIFGQLFEAGTGLPTTVTAFRNKYNRGAFVWDLRLACRLSPQIKLAFICKNMLNTVYAERPAIIAPPRNFTLQLSAEL
jgi:outer membrane cobalamin receptor